MKFISQFKTRKNLSIHHLFVIFINLSQIILKNIQNEILLKKIGKFKHFTLDYKSINIMNETVQNL
jgi:hypothetical protein